MFRDLIALTLNPALDVSIWIERLDPEEPVRAFRETVDPGGKAVNVARTLVSLGVPCDLFGLTGPGNAGRLEERLAREKIPFDFLPAQGFIRENLSVILSDGMLYKIDRPGIFVSKEDLERLAIRLASRLAEAELPLVIFSGSLPGGMEKEDYIGLIRLAAEKKALFAIDTAFLSEADIRELHPFAIKPNRVELEQLAGTKFSGLEEAASYAKSLARDVSHVLVSLGENGILYAGGKRSFHVTVPKVNAISPVAAGDTALAGFLAALSRGDKTEEAVRFAAACGTASVTKEGTARISPEDGRKVLPLVSFPRKI